MKYSDGHEAEIGDIVVIGEGITGRVVVLVKEGVAANGFVPEEWSYLKEGIVVESSAVGLMHYPENFTERLSLGIRS